MTEQFANFFTMVTGYPQMSDEQKEVVKNYFTPTFHDNIQRIRGGSFDTLIYVLALFETRFHNKRSIIVVENYNQVLSVYSILITMGAMNDMSPGADYKFSPHSSGRKELLYYDQVDNDANYIRIIQREKADYELRGVGIDRMFIIGSELRMDLMQPLLDYSPSIILTQDLIFHGKEQH